MTLVFQILIAAVVLVGLIAAIMSVKNWHWAQMLLLLAIFLSSVGTLLLGMEVFRVHRAIRSGMPAKERQLADLLAANDTLLRGSNTREQAGRVIDGLTDAATLATKAEALADSLPGTTDALAKLTDPKDVAVANQLRSTLQATFGTSDPEERQALLRNWAAKLNSAAQNERLQQAVVDMLNAAVEKTGQLPSLGAWQRQLVDFNRARGRVWRNVAPAGPIDAATGRIAVVIAEPKPHGLERDAIVYAFEQGSLNPAAPEQGAQYLGEFRVVETSPDGAVLESAVKLDNRTGGRLVRNQQGFAQNQGRPWALYETIPADSHELYAGLTEEQLQQLLPAASVAEYVRHGAKGSQESFPQHERAAFDDAGHRLGPADESKAAEWRYDRPLRDYALLFADATRQRVIALAERAAIIEDVAKLKTANELAQKLGAQRAEEKEALAGDLVHMRADRQAIESLLATVKAQIAVAEQRVSRLLEENSQRAAAFAQEQQGRVEGLPGAPSDAAPFATSP